MLRNVLTDYFSRLPNERALDVPFIAILQSAGYDDIFFTHGRNEMGKDFIAKRTVDGLRIQFSFQTKHGDLSLTSWRDDVLKQMLLAAEVGLPHPAFDRSLPQRAVLVLTGELKGNAQAEIAEFNRSRALREQSVIDVWNRTKLVELCAELEPTAVYATDPKGFEAYGDFFKRYGEAIGGTLDPRSFEKHSRSWLRSSPKRTHLFVALIEAHAVAQRAAEAGQKYEACQAILAGWRAVMNAWWYEPDDEYLRELMLACQAAAYSRADEFCNSLDDFMRRERLTSIGGAAAILSYRLACLRYAECAALCVFLANGEPERERQVKRLRKMLVLNPGAHQPLSDRFGVAIISAARACWDFGDRQVARQYVRDAATWTFARYVDDRPGIASVDEDESEVAIRLLQTAPRKRRHTSLIATALADIAAYFGDESLYDDIVNDIEANEIVPEYYQVADTEGQFRVEATDVTVYCAGVGHRRPLSPFHVFSYAQHVEREANSFVLATHYGAGYPLALSLLLRDRWFPTTWTAACSSAPTRFAARCRH